MDFTPKKNFELQPPIFRFVNLIDQETKAYICKECKKTVKMFGSTTSNLRKHLLTTNPEKHRHAVDELTKLESTSPTIRNSKRIRTDSPQSLIPLKNLINMGAITPKKKFNYNDQRQVEW